MTAVSWVAAIASLVGVWLNIRRNVACFWIWLVTNSAWVVVDLHAGIFAQAALQGVYVGLSIYGILSWSRKSQQEEVAR